MAGRALGWWFADNRNEFTGADDGFEDSSALNAPQEGADGDAGGSSPEGGQSAPAYDEGNGTAREFAIQAPDNGMSDGGSSFFDDGGWLSLALVATCILFMALALMMGRKLRPKPLDPESAQAAEQSVPPQL